MVQFPDRCKNVVDNDRRKTHRRFVQQQKLRLCHDRPSHCQHLLLTTGKASALLISALCQPGEQLIDFIQFRLDVIALLPTIRTHQQVFVYRHITEDLAAFRDLNHATLHDPCAVDFSAQLLTFESNASLIGHQSGDAAEQRRFSCAICADDRDDLSFVHFQTDRFQCHDAAIGRSNIFHLQQRFAHSASSSSLPR